MLAALLVAGGAGAQPPPADSEQAQRELAARQAFVAGRYSEALELFARLYADTQHPTYLRNVGRCYQRMKQPEKAIDSFRDYLRIAHPPPEARAEVEGFIAEMEALERQQRAQRDAPAPAPPRPSTSAALDEALVRRAPEPPPPSRTWLWVGGGAVLVAAAAVTAFLLLRPTTVGTACAPHDCTLPTTRVDTR